jgi:hypothetical protein
MTLTPSQRRAWARHGNREIHRTIDDAKAQLAAAEAARPRARSKRAPAVDIASIRPGDRIVTVTGSVLTVRRVNRASVTVESGTRWTASEITGVIES